MFRIEMAWTGVSYCVACACINWFTCYLISHVSLVVAVPLSHFHRILFNRHLLDCGLSGRDMFSESVLSNCTADLMVGLWD